MYDANADARAGPHNPTGLAEFEVFRASDHPDLHLGPGWYWDLPINRIDCPTTPRIDGRYMYANGPFDTSTQAYDHAMKDDGDLTN